MGIEDLVRQIEEDERKDALETLEYISIGDYARAKGIRPQQIHYHLRTGHIQRHHCPCCGRLVIKIEEANAVLQNKKTTRAGVRADLMDEEVEDGTSGERQILEGDEDLGSEGT
jgi:hypothetical protein